MQAIMTGRNTKSERISAYKAENSFQCQTCAAVSMVIKECSECFEYNCKQCLTGEVCQYCEA